MLSLAAGPESFWSQAVAIGDSLLLFEGLLICINLLVDISAG
jgi:hypothetical protein